MACDTLFRFFVVAGSDRTQVYPLGEWTIRNEKERDAIFFRRKFQGRLTFINDHKNGHLDYDFFYQIETSSLQCDELEFVIEKCCDDVYSEYWRGVFTTGMGSFDLDKCIFEVSPNVLDKYACFMKSLDKEVNILEVLDLVEARARIDLNNEIEFHYCRGATSAAANTGACSMSLPAPSGTWTKIFTNSVSDGDVNGGFIAIYGRLVKVTQCTGLKLNPPEDDDQWVLKTDNCGVDGTAIYVKALPPPATVIDNPEVQSAPCGELPPALKALNVTLVPPSGIPDRFDVLGYDTVIKNQIFTYRIYGAASSTYLWTVDSNCTIMSGQGTDTVTVKFNILSSFLNGVDLTCNETTTCGVIQHHKIINVKGISGPSGGGDPSPIAGTDKRIFANDTACPDEDNIFFEIEPEWRWNVPTAGGWSFNTDYFDLVSQTTYTLTLRAKGKYGTTSVSFTHSNPYGPSGNSTGHVITKTVTIAKRVTTQAISGRIHSCDASTGVTYKVPPRSGSTYAWSVGLGTVVSGQGTNEITVDWSASGPTTATVFVKEEAGCNCAWITLADCEVGNGTPYFWCPNVEADVIYRQTRSLKDVIEYMIGKTFCGDIEGDVLSDILEWNPVGDTAGYASGINYVNGSQNKYNNLLIAQKSDIVKPNASNPATIGKWTFKKLFTFFREAAQIYWVITDSGHLRFEHISAFQYSNGLDLTLGQYRDYVLKTNKYNHDVESVFKHEKFRWMESNYRDFVGAEIRYDAACANQDEANNTIEHNVPDVTTDITMISFFPDKVSLDGFVVLACDSQNMVYSEIGVLSGNVIANAPMSWANLHDVFWRHDRYLPQGTMNEQVTDFESYKTSVRQVPLTIPICCDRFDPNDNVTTTLTALLDGALGRVDTAEENILSQTITLNLSYSYINI